MVDARNQRVRPRHRNSIPPKQLGSACSISQTLFSPMSDQQASRSKGHLSEHFVISYSRFHPMHSLLALTAPLSEVDNMEAFQERERLHSGVHQDSFSAGPSASHTHQVSTFYGARDFTINGSPHFMNVGKYIHSGGGGTHGACHTIQCLLRF